MSISTHEFKPRIFEEPEKHETRLLLKQSLMIDLGEKMKEQTGKWFER